MIKKKIKLSDQKTEIAFYAIEDFDETVSTAIEEGMSENAIPIFGDLWPSGRALADFIAKEHLSGKTVLELGCGLGLASIAAAKAGARLVYATDYNRAAEEFVLKNAELNRVSKQVKFLTLDWQNFQNLLGCDYIIGSDLIYDPTTSQFLISQIRQQMKDQTKVFLMDPGRVQLRDFLRLAEKKGLAFVCEKISEGITLLRI